MMKNIFLVTICMIGIRCCAVSADDTVSKATTENIAWAEQAFSIDNNKPPFSFTYNGRHSDSFIYTWKKHVLDKKISSGVRMRKITYIDPETKLEVKIEAKIYTDSPGTDWIIYFTNNGSDNTPIIENVRAIDETFTPSVKADPVVHRLKGNVTGAQHSFDDFLAFKVKLSRGMNHDFGTPIGLSSNEESPFFNLQWDDGGVITAIGWTGYWKSAISYGTGGEINLSAGMGDMRLYLKAGESIRSPRILQVRWSGSDHLRSYNLFRKTMFKHIMPKINGKPVAPPISHATNCFYSQNSGTEKEILEYFESFKDLGFECLWLDAFYMKGGWPDGVGNYHMPLDSLADPIRYPNGLKPISDAAHSKDMIFLLWTAPERAVKGTWLYENHPEWLLGTPGQQVKLYDLGNDEAREYMTDYLLKLIDGYRIECIRFDCGALIGDLRLKDSREPNRTGMAEIRYHEGLYKMWDDILAARPNVFIDNCCGGGNRIDLETCARSLPLWRTDANGYTLAVWNPRDLNATAIQNQIITGGLSRYMPFNTGGTMGADPYMIRSAFNAGMTFTEDTRPVDYPKDMLKQGIIEQKRIRKYCFGDFYPLTEMNADPTVWCVFQYNRDDKGDGMILAYRRDKSVLPKMDFLLYDIDPNAEYLVKYYYGYKLDKTETLSGRDFCNITINISDNPGSLLIEYKKQ